MKKCSFCTLWLPTLITAVITVFVFISMYLFLHHSLHEMLQAHKHTQELTKKIEKMTSATLNATFLGNEEGFLEATILSNEIHDHIFSIKQSDKYNTALLFESYEQLYKKLISAVSYSSERRLDEASAALEAVKAYTRDLENRMDGLNNHFRKKEQESERILFSMMFISGFMLLFIALFNGFYLIPKRVIQPLEEFTATLEKQEEKYRIVADWTHDWEYWVGVDKNFVFITPSVLRVTGYSVQEFVQNPLLLVQIIHPEDMHIWEEHVQSAHKPNRPEEDAQSSEFRIIRKDGGVVYIDHICRPVYNHDGTFMGIRVANRDITPKVAILTELKEKNRLLDALATTDALSGLYNRRFFNEALIKEVQRVTREQHPLSLVMCDIDYFKFYNDSYGHQAGDRVIKEVATLLKEIFSRTTDIVARYGGEEFIILIPSTPREEVQRLTQQARENIEGLKIAHSASEVSQFVTMSFGIAYYKPDMVLTPDEFLKTADDALYKSKEKGRNCVCVN